MSGRFSGASPIATICTCWCNRCARWRADRWPGWWRRARATPMNGRRKRPACSKRSTNRASPAPSWIRRTAGSSKGPRTWRWRWWRLSWPGWMRARPPAAWRDAWRFPPFTSAAPRSSASYYMSRCAPGEGKKPWRGAFCLTEPIPYVGVETGLLGGKVRVAEWPEGAEPMLQVEKRGRFITNIGFANFVTAAVDSDDPRIKGIVHGDPGGERPRHFRPRHAHAQAGAPALLHARSDFQPESSGQPHRGRIHGEGRVRLCRATATARSSKPFSGARA